MRALNWLTFLKKFDLMGLFFFLEQAKSHSESLLEDWLPKHKFKNWKKRKSSGKDVTAAYKRARAKAIAKVLGDAERWHSHGRGIGIRELTSEEIKLQVVNFGENAEMNGKIRSYYDLFTDYCGKLGSGGYNLQHSYILMKWTGEARMMQGRIRALAKGLQKKAHNDADFSDVIEKIDEIIPLLTVDAIVTRNNASGFPTSILLLSGPELGNNFSCLTDKHERSDEA